MISHKKYAFIFLVLIFTIQEVAFAETIKKILIEGNKKISKEAIIDKIQSTVGKPYSKNQVLDDVKNIFDMGHFYDIEVYKEKRGIKICGSGKAFDS